MRISEVNAENYKEYLKILGVKDTKHLDKMWGNSNNAEKKDFSHEAREARMVALGYIEEGMLIRDGDTSWRKIVPVSDEIKNKLVEVVRRQTLANGDLKGYARDGDEIGAIFKEYRKTVAPSDRLSVTYTLSRIVQAETQRIDDYVHANVPGWKHGQPIPDDVLKAAVSGVDFDFKA
ncbi:MAG: DUF3879 family protein [Oscillospiraceae bacterium]|jgi:hypothetical protein|nr:DUF3879 family protein [Oscillospiraceae bacterium]